MDQVESSHIYLFDEFRLDTADESLRRNGEKLNINHRTFQVLRLLVERSGEVVTKQDFFDTVWADTFVEDNSLTVAITTLRKILGESAKDARFIENLPRRGYRFIGEVSVAQREETTGSPASSPHRLPSVTKRAVFLTAFACIAFFVLVLAFNPLGDRRDTSPAKTGQIDSIAVLPFKNETPDTEYLSDGLADSLATSLAGLPNLRVISRNSTFRYKNREMDPSAIGLELQVRAVLTGRMSQRGDVIVIDAELLDLLTGQRAWMRRYERPFGEAPALRKEMAADVAEFLGFTGSGARARSGGRGTDDPEAYQLYLKGRYYWDKRTEVDIRKSLDLFQQAVDRDPTFALGYIGLANGYAKIALDPIATDEDRVALVIGAAQKALEIDENLGEAYTIIAFNECYYKWDLEAADRHYQRALELSPNYSTLRHWYAEFLAMQGRFEESFREYDAALALDPHSFAIMTDRAFNFYYARQYDRAVGELEKIKHLNPNYERTYHFLYFVYQEKGMFAEAMKALDEFYSRQAANKALSSERLASYRALNARSVRASKSSGAAGYWRSRIDFLMGEGADGPSPYGMAAIHARFGEHDKAFAYLEKSIANHDLSLLWLKVSPDWDNIRSDPRFVDALHRIGFSN